MVIAYPEFADFKLYGIRGCEVLLIFKVTMFELRIIELGANVIMEMNMN